MVHTSIWEGLVPSSTPTLYCVVPFGSDGMAWTYPAPTSVVLKAEAAAPSAAPTPSLGSITSVAGVNPIAVYGSVSFNPSLANH